MQEDTQMHRPEKEAMFFNKNLQFSPDSFLLQVQSG